MEEEKLNKIYLAVGKLQGEVSTGFLAITNRLDRMNGTISNHEGRINKNETERDKAKGVLSIIGFIAGAIASAIISVFFYIFRH